MLGIYDYIIICFYLVFMLAIGWVFRLVNKDSSDYFRGGGNMLWWMTGASSVAAGLTAYTFTAASAKVFETGFFLILVYGGGVLTLVLIYFFLAARYRQMRVVTSADAIRRRYGEVTEQFWVWTALPLGVFNGGMGLYIVALFISTALGMDIIWCIVILAATVTIMAGTGGAWAIAAGSFLQILIIFTVAGTVFIRSLLLPQLGGISGFLDKMPSHFVNFSEFERPAVWMVMLTMFIVTSLLRAADINGQGSKYLSVKDGKHAKRSTLLMIFGNAMIPILAFTPVMIAGVLQFNLAEQFPELPNPGEGAYLAIARAVLPEGMMGMLVCAIFAATMSTMDAALNKSSGFFVKNFYVHYLRPKADEKELLKVGILLTCFFGAMVTGVALLINLFRGADLFSLLLKLNVLLDYPMIVPMMMGILWRRSPGWSAWSTVLIGMGTAWMAQTFVSPQMAAGWLGVTGELSTLEASDLSFVSSGVITLAVSFTWFFFTSIFYKKSSAPFRREVDAFFHDVNTPIDHVAEASVDQDQMQYKTMGLLCAAYGGALLLGILIPNEFNDRMVFFWCGGVFVGIGGLLYWVYLRRRHKEEGKC